MDRRIAKSHEALHAALAALIVAKGFDNVTIREIAEEANVGRTTFYAHFSSREALLRHGFERLRADLAEVATPTSQPLGFIEPLLRHARSHAGLYWALLGGSGGRIAEDTFRAIVDERIAVEAIGELERALLGGAVLGALRHWLANGGAIEDVAASLRSVAAALPTDR